jgi:hypothetical protein
MGLKLGLPLGLVAFGVTLAYYLSNRVSPNALDFATGALCGVLASVPVSIGLLVALGRQREAYQVEVSGEPVLDTPRLETQLPKRPQVIVIPPPQAQYNPAAAAFGFPGAGGIPYPSYTGPQPDRPGGDRSWRLIGGDQ